MDALLIAGAGTLDGALDPYRSVQPADGDATGEELLVTGAVVVRVLGRSRPQGPQEETGTRSPELADALSQPQARANHELLRWLRATESRAIAAAVGAALVVAAAGTTVQAALFRQLVDDAGARIIVATLLVVACLLALEVGAAYGAWGVARRIELGLRSRFRRAVFSLGDRYFQSRPVSDMAERGHTTHRLRLLPDLGGKGLRAGAELMATAVALVLIDAASLPLAAAVSLAVVGLVVAAQPVLGEWDLRFRTHAGALSRFYLDALVGLMPIRAHTAERSVRRQHEDLLGEWRRAGWLLGRGVAASEALQVLAALGLAIWVVVSFRDRGGSGAGLLLVSYWALRLPRLAQELALPARHYPELRSLALRLIEPLSAASGLYRAHPGTEDRRSGAVTSAGSPGVAVAFEKVDVVAAGQTILSGIDLHIEAGEHIAVIGASGAGKSSLVGLLLGWHRPAGGRLLVDGMTLDQAGLDELRLATAWVDPAVQLWNRSLEANLAYGSSPGASSLETLIDAAQLRELLEHLPEGHETLLGEAGGLVSGGEGQRVRLGRGMARPDARLVILDEPFRGLDRRLRSELLQRARKWWWQATLVCITHDVAETQSFPRVLVMEGGGVVEHGSPAVLGAEAASRYAELLRAEGRVRRQLGSARRWRQLHLEQGRLTEKRTRRR
jgi:ATP-binding cassette subfamily B protein